MRAWAAVQTGHDLGYVEQLYTFADRGRSGDSDRRIAISYLALTHGHPGTGAWARWYDHLPWEDHRTTAGTALARELSRALASWAAGQRDRSALQAERVAHAFGLEGEPWRPELALHRYELLWEAGLVDESGDARKAGTDSGVPMLHDHRRILATGVARLRSMLQYRPVIFELMPDEFTLGRLQRCVEALAGQVVHTQNFRRLVEQRHQLVEPTGMLERNTGGRPARLYRYRSEVFRERRHVGTKLPLPRQR
jgi:hypothetical protein